VEYLPEDTLEKVMGEKQGGGKNYFTSPMFTKNEVGRRKVIPGKTPRKEGPRGGGGELSGRPERERNSSITRKVCDKEKGVIVGRRFCEKEHSSSEKKGTAKKGGKGELGRSEHIYRRKGEKKNFWGENEGRGEVMIFSEKSSDR